MDDLNRPETEEDGIRAEALRRLKVRQLLQVPAAQTPDSSPSQSNTPATTESPSDAKPSM
jgi:hypothetical protein